MRPLFCLTPVAALYRLDQSTVGWADAVVAAGGVRPTDARIELVNTLDRALKTSGLHDTYADYGIFAAENATQALVSHKQRILGAVGGGTATFTQDRDYAFSASGWINSHVIPSVHGAGVMSGLSQRLGVYERTNVGTTSALAMGAADATYGFQVNPRGGANVTQCSVSCSSFNSTATVTDSRGQTSAFRSDATTWGTRKNGVDLTNATTPTAQGTGIVTTEVYLGGRNNQGVAASFRACSIGYWFLGGAISPALEVAEYSLFQTYMTAVGANV